MEAKSRLLKRLQSWSWQLRQASCLKGLQEVHVAGASFAGLAFAIRLAENVSAGCRVVIFVWDGRLRRLGLRRRRFELCESAKSERTSQLVVLHNEILSACLTADTQAAILAQGKEQLWEGTFNTSTINLEQALLKHAQSPALLQHIHFKPYDLSKHVLRAIASRPNVIIIGADGHQSTIRNLFPSAEESLVQQDAAHGIEIVYDMAADLQSSLKESAATSLIHTLGQRVFLHNFNCHEGVGTINIRVTEDEYNARGQCDEALTSLDPHLTRLHAQGTQVPQPSSPAAVIVPDLIDSALQMYGVPASAVTRTAGVCRSFWHAPCFAQKLHEGSEGGAVVMLIGDAAMQVEFWPGRGGNTALAAAHLAAVTLLSRMTHDPAQPCFAVQPAHLAQFSRQMTDMAARQRVSSSMDVLALPPPSSRWSEVAAKTPEEVVHQLMEQICDRGATAVDHLWPILPSHALIEARLRQLLPNRVHVLRRMLRDGPWPGHGAKVMAPLDLPPLPARQTFPSTVLSRQDTTAPEALTAASQAQAVRFTTAPIINNAAPARGSLSVPAAMGRIKTPRKLSWDTDSGQSASSSVASSTPADSPAVSDIDVKIAVLTKWGQQLPQLPTCVLSDSSSNVAPGHAKRAALRPVLKKKKQQQTAPQESQTLTHSSGQSQALSGIENQSSLCATGQNTGSDLPAQSTALASTTQASDYRQRQSHLDRAASSRHQASPTALSQASATPVQSSCMPQAVLKLPTLSSSAVQLASDPPAQTSQPSQSPSSVSGCSAVQLPVQSPQQMWPHVRILNVPQPLKAPTPPKQATAPPEVNSCRQKPSKQATRALATLPRQRLLPHTELRSCQSVGRQHSPAAPPSQPNTQAASPATSSGQQLVPAVSQVMLLGQHQSPTASPAEPSSQPSPHACPLSGQPRPPNAPSATPSLQRQSPAMPSTQHQTSTKLSTPDVHPPAPPTRPLAAPPPVGAPEVTPSGAHEPARPSLLQNSTPAAALTPRPILRSSTAPSSSMGWKAPELQSSSQRQSDSPSRPQTPLPGRQLRHVHTMSAGPSDMCLWPDSIRHLQSQRASHIMHAAPALPDIRVRPPSTSQIQAPEWLLQADSNHDAWRTPQLPSTWSGQGNPLFGWWELGSAIVGDTSEQPPTANLSPCTPHINEVNQPYAVTNDARP